MTRAAGKMAHQVRKVPVARAQLMLYRLWLAFYDMKLEQSHLVGRVG
jgi:hypothetical protein